MIVMNDTGLLLEGTWSDLIDDMCNVCYAMLTKEVITTEEFMQIMALVMTRYEHPEEFDKLEEMFKKEEASA